MGRAPERTLRTRGTSLGETHRRNPGTPWGHESRGKKNRSLRGNGQGTSAYSARLRFPFPRLYSALAAVAENPGCAQSHTATSFGVSEVAVTQVVEELVDRGLIWRDQDSRDRRAYQVTFTRTEHSITDSARVAIADQEALFLAPITKGKAAQLLLFLKRLVSTKRSAGYGKESIERLLQWH